MAIYMARFPRSCLMALATTSKQRKYSRKMLHSPRDWLGLCTLNYSPRQSRPLVRPSALSIIHKNDTPFERKVSMREQATDKNNRMRREEKLYN